MLTGKRGMAPIVLIILIAWALLSVLFLTGTLLAARSIDRSVAVIKPEVIEIGDEARFIREAKKIADATVEIRRATQPLTGLLDRTERTARRGIDPRLKSILGTVGNINETAGQINTTVLQIGSTVDSIFSSASSISGSVSGIGGSVNSINRSTRTINASARSILGSAGGILSRVNSIDRAVAGINRQADNIADVGGPIASDLNNTLKLVGTQGPGGHRGTIHGHANAIDCSPALISPLATGGGLLAEALAPLLVGDVQRRESLACGT
jgi:methyl-accepting chemotaxis protein